MPKKSVEALMIKSIRESNNLSQTEMAKKLGLHVNSIYLYENDKSSITAANLRIIIQYYGADYNEEVKKAEAIIYESA